jgi:hypothetical protein
MDISDYPNAKLVRLQNGDDVISEVVEMEDENGVIYALFHPLKVVYVPSETTGYLTVAFMPWVFPRLCEQQEFIIHSHDILFMADVTPKMNEYYWNNMDYYTKKATAEEEKETQKAEQEDSFDRLKEALEEAGLYNKKVYH